MGSRLEFSCEVCGAKKVVDPNPGYDPYAGIHAPPGWFRVRGWKDDYRQRDKIICSVACVQKFVDSKTQEASAAIHQVDDELRGCTPNPDKSMQADIHLVISWVIPPPPPPDPTKS